MDRTGGGGQGKDEEDEDEGELDGYRRRRTCEAASERTACGDDVCWKKTSLPVWMWMVSSSRAGQERGERTGPL